MLKNTDLSGRLLCSCLSVALVALLSSCTAAKTVQREVEELVVTRKDAPPPQGERLSDRELRQIVERESELLLELSLEANDWSAAERDRRLMEIVNSYESFLSRNSTHIEGYVLYGKFLRRLDERERANQVFLKANKLDPNMAPVKQQIGNYLAETGRFDLALPYFLAAIELSPTTALYHYQLGELLSTYGDQYVNEGILERAKLEQQMHEAFRRASELAPENRDFAFRRAEAWYDVVNKDWDEALRQWESLQAGSRSEREASIIRLQRARVYMLSGRPDEARPLLELDTSPALEQSRQELYARLP